MADPLFSFRYLITFNVPQNNTVLAVASTVLFNLQIERYGLLWMALISEPLLVSPESSQKNVPPNP
jgi:hypothetical protein